MVTRPMVTRTLAIRTLVPLLLLAGCSGGGDPVPVAPATTVVPGPSAASPACSRLISRLPATLLDVRRSAAPARGTAGWGAIVLRCGVEEPGPTSAGCIGVNGVDWVFSEDASRYRFVTFGRSPAVEVTVPTSIDRTRAPGAMAGLADAVRPLATTKRTCE